MWCVHKTSLANKCKTLCCVTVFALFICDSTDATIDCFKCISINNDYRACDDPFHNNYTTDIYESPCMGGRKGRDGVYPATSCIKISGVFDDNGDRITVRGCALDSGTVTTDTEIVRMSHCGALIYDGRYVRGCLQSCNDVDACNISSIVTINFTLLILLTLANVCKYFICT